MAKRRPDPRVRTNATPQCTVTIGKNANKELALKMLAEKCSAKDCTEHPVVSRTIDGTIERFCLVHYADINGKRATQAELEMFKRWAIRFAQAA